MSTEISHHWLPIALPTDPAALEVVELRAFEKLWQRERESLREQQAVEAFDERMARWWSIETGIIEQGVDQGAVCRLSTFPRGSGCVVASRVHADPSVPGRKRSSRPSAREHRFHQGRAVPAGGPARGSRDVHRGAAQRRRGRSGPAGALLRRRATGAASKRVGGIDVEPVQRADAGNRSSGDASPGAGVADQVLVGQARPRGCEAPAPAIASGPCEPPSHCWFPVCSWPPAVRPPTPRRRRRSRRRPSRPAPLPNRSPPRISFAKRPASTSPSSPSRSASRSSR